LTNDYPIANWGYIMRSRIPYLSPLFQLRHSRHCEWRHDIVQDTDRVLTDAITDEKTIQEGPADRRVPCSMTDQGAFTASWHLIICIQDYSIRAIARSGEASSAKSQAGSSVSPVFSMASLLNKSFLRLHSFSQSRDARYGAEADFIGVTRRSVRG
jgi:hypothetical protein